MNEFRLNNRGTALVNIDVYDWIDTPGDDMLTNLSSRNKYLENTFTKNRYSLSDHACFTIRCIGVCTRH